MKKSMVIITTILCLSITGCSGSTATASPTNVESKAIESSINMDITDSMISYDKFEILENEGTPVLRVYLTYTNNADKDSCAMDEYYINVYQNKIQCDSAFLSDENVASDNMTKGVLKDGSLQVAAEYKLQDTTSPVTLSVEPCFNDDFAKQEMVIDITQGQ